MEIKVNNPLPKHDWQKVKTFLNGVELKKGTNEVTFTKKTINEIKRLYKKAHKNQL